MGEPDFQCRYTKYRIHAIYTLYWRYQRLKIAYLISFLYSTILCWLTRLRPSPSWSSSILWIAFLNPFNWSHKHRKVGSVLFLKCLRLEAITMVTEQDWSCLTLPYLSGDRWSFFAVCWGAGRTAVPAEPPAHALCWTGDGGRIWARIHQCPAGSLRLGPQLPRCSGWHA